MGSLKNHKPKHARSSHVDPYVIVYRVRGNIIQFLYVDHHDFVYPKAVDILEKIEIQRSVPDQQNAF